MMTRASSSDKSSLTTFSYIVFALIIIFVVLGWQVYSMYYRAPAMVTRSLDIMYRNAGAHNSLVVKRAYLLERCTAARISGNTSVQGLRYPDSVFCEGNTFIVVYTDTLELPGFSSHIHSFRIEKDLSGEHNE